MYIPVGWFMGLFIPSVGLTVVLLFFALFLCLGVIRLNNPTPRPRSQPQQGGHGLTEEDLEKLPKVTGKDLVMATDCAVCLDEITEEQDARLVPGCNHGFHRECADQWLARNAACPVCRAPVQIQTQPDDHTNNPV